MILKKVNFQPGEAFTKDSGLVLVLILLLIAYWRENLNLLLIAIGALLIALIVPAIFTPLAIFWHYLSMGVGRVINSLILSIIFFLVVTPVGFVRRGLGFDPMKRKRWKKGRESVLTIRNSLVKAEDLEAPY